MTGRERILSESPEILDACCGGRHWWWDKAHPLAVYMDNRVEPNGAIDMRPNFSVAPDVQGDFRQMPFADESFNLVLFDPPHVVRDHDWRSYTTIRYGALVADSAEDDLRRGFAECWRVLALGGTLIFKWSGKWSWLEPLFPSEPIVGTRTVRPADTRWFIFYKPLTARAEIAA